MALYKKSNAKKGKIIWIYNIYNVSLHREKTKKNYHHPVIFINKYHPIIFINMVKHIILWKLKEELTEAEKTTIKQGIKAGLESLVGQVPGLIECKVNIDGRLDSSNCDVMLDSTLESPAALKGYATHPAHVAVADSKVRPYTAQRTCLDFEI